jgi:RNA polymerase sigma-70 factor (ECF subfamily)
VNVPDDDRLAALYRRYGPVIYWRCLKLLGNPAAAEDAAQETFLRVHVHLQQAPEAEEAVRWIYRIATNYCLNELRDRRRDPQPVGELPEQAGLESPEAALADRELAAKIVARAPEKLRVVAWARYVDGLDLIEIAARLGLSRHTVASRLADFEDRARKFVGRS